MSDYITVFVTAASNEEAEKIGTTLVEEGLAACANMLSGIESIFKWKGESCREKEVLLIIKSRSSLFARIEERVKTLHSYEVPEIIALPITSGSQAYLDWIDEMTS